MKNLRERLASDAFLGPVFVLVSGTAMAQLATYLARPVLTRLFEPEAFGIFGFFLAMVAILGSPATGKYETAIPIPRDDREAASAVGLSLMISGVLTLLSLLVLPFRYEIATLFDRPEVADTLILVPLILILIPWARTLELWLTRVRHFKPIAGSKITQSVGAAATQIVTGLRGAAYGGLVGGYIIGTFLGLTTMLVSSWTSLCAAFSDIRWKDVKAAAVRYRRFPMYSMPSTFLNQLSLNLPLILLLVFFAPEISGYYMIAFTTLAVPLQLVGSSISQVFFAHAAEAYRNKSLSTLTAGTFRKLSAVGIVPLAILLVAGPQLFSIVFGADWYEAGFYTALLAPWMFFTFLSNPLSSLFDVLERQSTEFLFNVLLLIARLGGIMTGVYLNDPRIAVGLYALVSALFWAWHTALMIRWSNILIFPAFRIVSQHALTILPLIAGLVVITFLTSNVWLVSGSALIVGIAGLLLLYKTDPEIRKPIIRMMN